MRQTRIRNVGPGHILAFLTGVLATLLMVGVMVDRPMSNGHALPHYAKRADAAEDPDILQFGNPGPVSDLLKRESYTASYDRRLRLPHWVGEHLTPETLSGNVTRDSSSFKEDQDLPEMFRALLKDYKSSGYDRGHMAPAGDAVQSQEAMDQTFLLSNMSPQVGVGFNRHYWKFLETFVRDLVSDFKDVYVFTGPIFLPHTLGADDDYYTYGDKGSDKNPGYEITYPMIGNVPNVHVPTHFYKVLLVPVGESSSDYAMGAFVLPNQKIESSTKLTDFQVKLEAVESASGLTFFDKLDRSKFKDLCEQTKCTLSSS